MKTLKWLALLGLGLMYGSAYAASDTSLENDLNNLAVPADTAPTTLTSEQLYSVQNRYSPLEHRSEIAIGGLNNFTPDAYVLSEELSLSYRYYISNRWFLGASGSYVFNSLSDAGVRLNQAAINPGIPDMAYAKYRADLMGGFNVFYGKFRFSMDQVFYFDQYVALGPGLVDLNTGWVPAGVADVGFSFWFGRKVSARIGFKDYLCHEIRVKSQGLANNILGHLDVGILL